MVTYKQAGVDIDKANLFVNHIKKIAPNIGGFSGLFPINNDLLLSGSCDGVGTKLRVAHILKKHDTIGIDLVAMNVNDVICSGAKPLFFLDYFATSKLDLKMAQDIIKGIKKGCDQAGCMLLGGETAEMPGFYQGDDYDLAGFVVGMVNKKDVIDGQRIKPGDKVIGLPSSGPHSNGYSLIRKVLNEGEIQKWGKQLLAPTKIYVREVLNAIRKFPGKIHGMAHITGGGFYDNIIRILPENCKVIINKNSWNIPKIFKVIQEKGNIPEHEMYRTLNMGIGLVLIVDQSSCAKIQCAFDEATMIGEVVRAAKEVVVV